MAITAGRTPARPDGVGSHRSLADGAQLAALWSLTVVQPVFHHLGREHSPIVTWSSSELAIFALGFTFLPPALMLAGEGAFGLIGDRPRRALHLLLVGALAGVFAGSLAGRAAPEDGPLIAGAIVIGCAAAIFAYIRFRGVRLFLTFLVVAPVLFGVPFVFDPPKNTLTLTEDVSLSPPAPDAPPVVLVILDELPTASLMDGKGGLDAKRLPNFERLARDATWYRDAVSVADQTNQAVPALLTGRMPDLDASASDPSYPGNLFTLLGRSHRMNVFESVTALCPAELCPQNAQRSFPRRVWDMIPTLRRLWLTGFLPKRVADGVLDPPPVLGVEARPRQREFRRAITPGAGPTLHYLHTFLPHTPWDHLPDGKRYVPGLREELLFTDVTVNRATGLPLVRDNTWAADSSLVAQAQQAHLEQVGAVDHALGKVLRRLKATGQYDRSLIILTADHGAAFESSQPFRTLTRRNAGEILHVPLFVKLPGQRRGRAQRGTVRSIDIVPTIADVVGVRLPWPADGRSLLEPRRPRGERLKAYSEFSKEFYTFAPRTLERQRDAAVRRNARLFGSGTPTLEVFELGPRPDLLGRSVSSVRGAGGTRVSVDLDAEEKLRSVDPDAVVLPAALHGELRAGPPGDSLAVVLNGRVAATTRSYSSGEELKFTALVPSSVFRPGANRVQVYAVPP